jgi:AraC-like DNA-binding protein
METYSLYDQKIQTGDYWATVEACYSRTWAGFKMSPHYHARIEIMYVLKGTCRIHILECTRDHMNKATKVTGRHVENLGPGEYILLDAGILHALEVPQDCYMANAEFSIRQEECTPVTVESLCSASSDFKNLVEKERPIIRGVDISGNMYTALSQVVECFAACKQHASARALMDTALAHLLVRFAYENHEAISSVHLLLHVKKALMLLHDRIQEDVRINDIAKEIGINPSYLQRIFKQTNGQTMIEYLNTIRIERAKFMLSCTEDPIVDIAVSVGYNSRQHFSHVFTMITGVSPQEYRKHSVKHQKRQLYMFDNIVDDFIKDETVG